MYEMISVLDRGLIGIRNKIKKDVINGVVKSKGYKTLTYKRKLGITNALNCFIFNSFEGYCRGHKKTSITLDPHNFSKVIVNGCKRKSSVSYTYTLAVIEVLEDLGYIYLNKGGRVYDWVRGKVIPVESTCSYLEFTHKLIGLYLPYKEAYKQRSLLNVLELRDENKKPKVFKQNSKTKVAKEGLNSYNTLSLMHTVLNPKGKHYNCQLKKIFNEDFNNGGRHFMTDHGIQNLTKQERMDLTINSNQTVIYDFKSFEPSIAYSVNQELMKDDPYQLEWECYDKVTLRKLGKCALTVMLYAKDKETSIAAINYRISEDFDIDTMYSEGLIPSPCIPVKRLVEALEEKNNIIMNLMYNPDAHNLSNLGSQIMDYIINYFTQRGICVLPVFDEVIIEVEHEDKLKDVMELAYSSVLGFTDNMHIVKEK